MTTIIDVQIESEITIKVDDQKLVISHVAARALVELIKDKLNIDDQNTKLCPYQVRFNL